MRYSVYDHKGELINTFKRQKDICDHFNIAESIVTRSIKHGYLLAGGHTLIIHPKGEDQPKKIKLGKTIYPKFRNPKTGRFCRYYLSYDLLGNLETKKPLTITEIMDFTGASKDTVLDAIRINNICKNHIIKICFNFSLLPEKLSPLSPEFRVYQYDRAGNFVQAYTRISKASEYTKIDYNEIRNNINFGFTYRSDYFFTGHISLNSMRHINPNFRINNKPKRVFVYLSSDKLTKKLLTINQASKLIGCAYRTLKNKVINENRFIYKGFLIEIKT